MSTSFLYHAFGLNGFEYVRQAFVDGGLVFTVKPKAKMIRCPDCESFNVIRRGCFERQLRTVPIGFKPVWLHIRVPRVECKACGSIRRIKLGIVDQRRSYTKGFGRFVLALARIMPLKDIAVLLGVGWDMVKDIFKGWLRHRFGRPKLNKLAYIAIDEISIRKGHTYVTLVLDLKSGAVVFVGEGKGGDALTPFWKRLRRSGATIKAVATDMSPAYIGAVLENLPGVPLVFDKFHVVKLMNEKLTEIRRRLHSELEDGLAKQVLKGSRWILVKNPEKLRKKYNEKERLDEALRLNEPLAMAYYLKEDLRQIWGQSDKEAGAAFLDDWIARSMASGVGPLITMAKTMAACRFGILAWYDHPISSAKMEGTNNKIKTMKRQAYGYRDQEFFRLRIMGIHEAKYALTG
ncbi:ISL3 family transposase [Desulfolutivibrio sulfoxidireducens]|uniref:ISL3 family transposase n=1 Tax=Desulfolutivibrio sulfoxidireducens TaxID=2773299 RepID=UPI00159E1EAD|nr:ISL3 family transposase [Desulfolutivibrio sulfoxidireducens]QLA17977.1 ISL3 family transposase [Desulfolutivibrio sulfoxidireducens]QLA17978.1 ISL3 family transposase [Desulfolutivibrio sulfoxidireducens]QLA17984.1 ISL3 family transposase [Desulfolutivibrio sulfoxidireducens]QLA18004.1 ISL3 family transposase [Desulfolutivibrio sulfoxidireducens]